MPSDEAVYLGFDFGTKRLGIAVGQTITQTARPLVILSVHEKMPNWQQVDQIIADWQPKALIVGMPDVQSEQFDKQIKHVIQGVKKFIKQLNNRYDLPIFIVNEHLTSREVHQRIDEGLIDRKHDDAIDDIAAQIILESWMRSN